MDKILIISDSDLDGSVSALLIEKWYKAFNNNSIIEHLHTNVKTFRTDITKYTSNHNLDEYQSIYVLDLDVHEDYKFIDFSNVVIVDHHKSHADNLHVYQNIKVKNICIYPSCAKLVYDVFYKNNDMGVDIELTKEEKILVLLTNDYDSYELKLKQSLPLNIVYWSYTGDRYGKFVEDFGNGFKEFLPKHLNMIAIWKNKFKETLENLMVFESVINIDNKEYKCCSIFGDFAINELSAHLFKRYNCDVVIVINQKSQRVYMRRNKNCNADMSKFALSMSDKEAGGHEAAAGCKLNNNIMELTKSFKRVK